MYGGYFVNPDLILVNSDSLLATNEPTTVKMPVAAAKPV
jgi:hypothetical protein